MRLEHSFEVEAPLERVWDRLIDIEQVAPCLPGAEVTESSEEGVYEGNFTIKLGPTTAAYAGKLQLTEVDDTNHRVTMSANGRDKRGQGSAKATIESSMSEAEGGTHVDVVTDFSLTGRLARFGRGGMIEDVSNKLVGDFVECLRSSLESEGATAPAGEEAGPGDGAVAAQPSPPPQQAQPVRGGRLFFSVLWMRIKRLFGGGRKR
jgi:carbon monoxide dehydrogenase subunit G